MSKGTLQKLTILGRLGCDPEIKKIKNCLVARLNAATTEMIKRKGSDSLEEETTWHRITLFNQKAEFCRDYLKKGDTVIVEARLRNSKWEDKDGKEHHSVDIIGYSIQQTGGSKKTKDKSESQNNDDPLSEIV
jgi:single-strand DNA-binding protein